MTKDTKQKVVEEIEQIPREKLPEIYDLIHHYRIGLEQGVPHRSQILELAGSWSEMTDEDFSTFLEEIAARRSNAFRRRRENDSRTT